MTGKLVVVADGFYGSCGKGHVTEMLLNDDDSHTKVNVRVGGPNAGHIVYGRCPGWCDPMTEDQDGPWGNEPKSDHLIDQGGHWLHPWKLRQIPVGAVIDDRCKLIIAAGSEINADTLMEEVRALWSARYPITDRLYIDRAATHLTEHHISQEKQNELTARLGSTAKGIGAARAERIWRIAPTWGEYAKDLNLSQWTVDSTAELMYMYLNAEATVIIEGTQGYGLGLHTENYPQVTSTDCRAIDFLAQAGLSPWHKTVGSFEPWLVLRTRPIRVAGNSGPMKGETTWEAVGLRPEKTTVTRKVRRVGEFDADLANRAIDANGGHGVVKVALTMVDQIIPGLAGLTTLDGADIDLIDDVDRYIAEVENQLDGIEIQWIGTGPVTGIWRAKV